MCVPCTYSHCFTWLISAQRRHTTPSVSITMSRPSTHSLIWPFVLLDKTTAKCFEQILNLNSGQEVGLYLFPAPVLFLPRDWSFGIVHPDNGAAPQWALLHCFVATPRCFVDLMSWPPHQRPVKDEGNGQRAVCAAGVNLEGWCWCS